MDTLLMSTYGTSIIKHFVNEKTTTEWLSSSQAKFLYGSIIFQKSQKLLKKKQSAELDIKITIWTEREREIPLA